MRLEPWGPDDLELVERLNAPEMMRHLGGPEPADKLPERQARYAGLAATGQGSVFRIVDAGTGRPAGQVAHWRKVWQDEDCYEMGWGVFPEFQGRGIGAAAVGQAVELLRASGWSGPIYAFPRTSNAASNAICRRLGFQLVAEADFEYPPGHHELSSVWVLR